MRVRRQLEHGLRSSLGNNAPPVVMKVIQQLELVFVSSMGNYISPVVMRAGALSL